MLQYFIRPVAKHCVSFNISTNGVRSCWGREQFRNRDRFEDPGRPQGRGEDETLGGRTSKEDLEET